MEEEMVVRVIGLADFVSLVGGIAPKASEDGMSSTLRGASDRLLSTALCACAAWQS